MKSYLKILGFSVFAALTIASCKKEKNEEEENDNELITTVQIEITEEGSPNKDIYPWVDYDGAGGEDPIVSEIYLKPSTIYNVKIYFSDNSQGSLKDITKEIEDESDVHRIYFTPSAGISVMVNTLDNDINGKPLGLESKWTSSSAGKGSMKITLRHYGNGGKETSDPVSSSKSSTDAEVEFPVFIDVP